MQKFDLILSVIALAGIVSTCRFVIAEKKAKGVSYAELLIDMIKSLWYKKEVLDNDYPEYHGKLEINDTAEFIRFLSTGILDKIGNSRNEG